VTAYPTVRLMCDDPSACLATFVPRDPWRTAREVRQVARSLGWTQSGHKDRCPKHGPSSVPQEGGKQ
jgi:hypothetical protein